jgi:hypothetical protein
MGYLADVEFEIKEPLLTGQSLPVIFGPFGEGNFGLVIFGLGNSKAAGTVYWLDGNTPDTQSDLNNLEITSPSEPLISGVMYDGYPFVWTTRRSFMMLPSVATGALTFIARENANSRGLFSKTAIVVGDTFIYHITENADGIVRIQGAGNPDSITSGSISSLFYNNGVAPQPVTLIDGTVVNPPDFTLPDENRLYFIKEYLVYRFKDITGKFVALIYSEKIKDWISYDTFIHDKVGAFYYEELESSSKVLVGGQKDIGGEGAIFYYTNNGEDIAQVSKVVPFSFDAGDSRVQKLFNEIVLSTNPGKVAGSFEIKNYFNNGDSSDAAIAIAGDVAPKRKETIIELAGGLGKLAQNLTTIFSWELGDGVKLYEELIYFIPQGDITKDRPSDVEIVNGLGEKLWQGVVIEADTFGQDKTLRYFDDQGMLKASITINHDGRKVSSKGFEQPFISHTIRRVSIDDVSWLPYNEEYVTDVEPEAARYWEGEFNTHDLIGLINAQRMGVAYRAFGAFTLRLIFDDAIEQEYTLEDTLGEYKKEFFFLIPKKWKACKYRIEPIDDDSISIRPYRRDCEIWVRTITSDNSFVKVTPFGGDSRVSEVRI